MTNTFNFVIPQGWTQVDASHLQYGSALLNKGTATDASILLGKLDDKLFAGAEPDDTRASVRLASDMGEFFFPHPGTRINQETIPLDAEGIPGAATYYEVRFADTLNRTPRSGLQQSVRALAASLSYGWAALTTQSTNQLPGRSPNQSGTSGNPHQLSR
jgi:hypothetical protein